MDAEWVEWRIRIDAEVKGQKKKREENSLVSEVNWHWHDCPYSSLLILPPYFRQQTERDRLELLKIYQSPLLVFALSPSLPLTLGFGL